MNKKYQSPWLSPVSGRPANLPQSKASSKQQSGLSGPVALNEPTKANEPTEPNEVLGRHKNTGQKDHKGAR